MTATPPSVPPSAPVFLYKAEAIEITMSTRGNHCLLRALAYDGAPADKKDAAAMRRLRERIAEAVLVRRDLELNGKTLEAWVEADAPGMRIDAWAEQYKTTDMMSDQIVLRVWPLLEGEAVWVWLPVASAGHELLPAYRFAAPPGARGGVRHVVYRADELHYNALTIQPAVLRRAEARAAASSRPVGLIDAGGCEKASKRPPPRASTPTNRFAILDHMPRIDASVDVPPTMALPPPRPRPAFGLSRTLLKRCRRRLRNTGALASLERRACRARIADVLCRWRTHTWHAPLALRWRANSAAQHEPLASRRAVMWRSADVRLTRIDAREQWGTAAADSQRELMSRLRICLRRWMEVLVLVKPLRGSTRQLPLPRRATFATLAARLHARDALPEALLRVKHNGKLLLPGAEVRLCRDDELRVELRAPLRGGMQNDDPGVQQDDSHLPAFAAPGSSSGLSVPSGAQPSGAASTEQKQDTVQRAPQRSFVYEVRAVGDDNPYVKTGVFQHGHWYRAPEDRGATLEKFKVLINPMCTSVKSFKNKFKEGGAKLVDFGQGQFELRKVEKSTASPECLQVDQDKLEKAVCDAPATPGDTASGARASKRPMAAAAVSGGRNKQPKADGDAAAAAATTSQPPMPMHETAAAKHKPETPGGGPKSKKAKQATPPVAPPSIQRMTSTTLGMIVLGELGVHEQVPEGMRMDFNADFNEYIKQAKAEERHECLSGLLNLLLTSADKDPQKAPPDADADSFSAEQLEQAVAGRAEAWKQGKLRHDSVVTDAREEFHQIGVQIGNMELDDAENPELSHLKRAKKKAGKTHAQAKAKKDELYASDPPKTETIAGLPFHNRSEADGSSQIDLAADVRPQVLAFRSNGLIRALVFVCDVEVDVDTPDDLLQKLCVAYVVRDPDRIKSGGTHAAHDETAGVLSEAGAHVEIPLRRDDHVFDVLLVHDGENGERIRALFGSQLLCAVVSKNMVQKWAGRNKARCVVVFTSEALPMDTSAAGSSAAGPSAKDLEAFIDSPCFKCPAAAIDAKRHEVLNFIMLCLCAPLEAGTDPKALVNTAKDAVKDVVRDAVLAAAQQERNHLPIVPESIDIQPPEGFSSLTVVVYATYKPPEPSHTPSGEAEEALVPMDAEDIKPPSFEQARVAEALLRRTRTMLGENKFNEFKDIQFLIGVPAFNTLKAQTAYRVRKAGLLDRERNEDEYSKVVMYTPGGSGDLTFRAFKSKALAEPTTLFVFIADECHYAPTRRGAQDTFINDKDMLEQKNVVVLLNSATPYNCMTRHSRIVGPDVASACNPLALTSTESDPESNVIRWRPTKNARYRSIDFYVDSVAFRVPSSRRRLSITITIDQVPTSYDDVKLFEDCERFGNMKDVADHVKNALEAQSAPLKLAYEKSGEERRFFFKPTKTSQTYTLELRGWEDDGSVLQLLGFTQEQCGTPKVLKNKDVTLRAEKQASIDEDSPLHAQRVRTDVSLAKLQSAFNDDFGSRKHKKRASTDVGRQTVDGASKPVTIQDGHLMLCDYLFSLAYFALLRVNPRWDVPGESMLLSVQKSQERLQAAGSIDGLLTSSPIPTEVVASGTTSVFKAILEKLAREDTPLEPCGNNSKKVLESYDMRQILCASPSKSSILETILAQAEDEDDFVEAAQADPLKYIFEEKLKCEKEAATMTDSQAWYTETDRNIRILLDQRRNRGGADGNGRGCIWGSMILMRVYDNQENMTMQTILRDALTKLGLARGGAKDPKDARAFSVLSDISNTVIADAIEPYFLEHDLRRSRGVADEHLWGFDAKGAVVKLPRDASKKTLAQILDVKKKTYQEQTARGVQMPKAELGYEDLHNLPMLLIVTEKARMGDTFPHSLAGLDLRMRTGGTLVAFVQELGRMCRYPTTQPLVQYKTLSELRADENVRQALEKDELPLMIVKANCTDRDIVCHISHINELSDDQCFGTPGLEARFDVHEYFDRLPCAIIREEMQEALIKGIKVKETQAPSKESRTSTLQCVNMKHGLDDYVEATARAAVLIKGIKDDDNPLHDYHTNYEPKVEKSKKKKGKKSQGDAAANGDQAEDEGVEDGGGAAKGKTPHYDAPLGDEPPPAKHERRLLLFAECQIGKTGAYLHYLTRLREEIRGGWLPDVQVIDDGGGYSWHFPYWSTMAEAKPLDYKQPKEGHYYEKVAKQRLAFLQKLARDGVAEWASKFCEWLKSPEGELIVSSTGVEKIDNLLSQKLAHAMIPVDGTGKVKTGDEHTRVLRWCIDWDDRMANLSALNEQLTDLQTPGYNAANAVWDNPAHQKALGPKPIKLDSTAARGMMALREAPHEPCVLNCKIGASLDCKVYGNGTELVSADGYALYVPHWMGVQSIPGLRAKVQQHTDLRVRRWIFTCSYGGATKITCRLNREHAMAPLQLKQYIQVLVVRDDDDLDGYRKVWGSSYIVAVLPKTMVVRYAKDALHQTLKVEVGRIGYARLFCQLFADSIGLEEIWMLDDNVERCWTIDTDEQSLPKKVDGVVQLQPCRFSSVMQGMELLLDRAAAPQVEEKLDSSSAYRESVRFDAARERRLACEDGLIAHGKGKSLSQLQPIAALHDYTGGKGAYGVLGMQRNNPQNRLRQSSGFGCTHSVYSFFLLNVSSTLGAGVLYPAKPIWEDIEFMHMVSDAGLAVCKFNKYIHMKKHLRTPPPPPPPTTTSLQQFLQERSYQFREYNTYPTDATHKWLNEGSSVWKLVKEFETTDTKECVLVGLEMPDDGNAKLPLDYTFSTMKFYARRNQPFKKLIVLVQYKEVADTEPPFTPSDADMLYWMQSPLSRDFVIAENGTLGYPHDGAMVHHEGEEYYVICFPIDQATTPGAGSKRKAPDSDSSTGGDGGEGRGESKSARTLHVGASSRGGGGGGGGIGSGNAGRSAIGARAHGHEGDCVQHTGHK